MSKNINALIARVQTVKVKPPKVDWRKIHRECMNEIRLAKMKRF